MIEKLSYVQQLLSQVFILRSASFNESDSCCVQKTVVQHVFLLNFHKRILICFPNLLLP